jgi:small subunit ribosomal protein S10
LEEIDMMMLAKALRFVSAKRFLSIKAGGPNAGKTNTSPPTTLSPAQVGSQISSSSSSSIPLFAPYTLPNNVGPAHPTTLKVQLKLKAFHSFYLTQFTTNLAKRMENLGFPKPSLVFLPKKIERWTVLRGPHIDKKARDQFERITHKRLVTIEIPSSYIVHSNAAAAAEGNLGAAGGAAGTPGGTNIEIAYRLLRSLSNVSAGVQVKAKYLVSMGDKVRA